jgi:hypothetical protein
METVKFEIITLDVWGNEHEGFEINDMHRTGDFVDITGDTTDKDILAQLIALDYVAPQCAKYAKIEWLGDDFVEVNDNRNGKYVYQLMKKM